MFRVVNYDEVSSTNELVKRAIEAGEPEGYAVCARRQTGGYGRQGRAWSSPEGGLYLSVLLRPDVSPGQLPTLSLVAALAVRRALVAMLSCATDGANDAGDMDGADRSDGANAADAANAAKEFKCSRKVGNAGSVASRRTPVLVKWPNDLVVAAPSLHSTHSCEPASFLFRKLCGISLEAHAGGVCVGIGVNVFRTADAGDSAEIALGETTGTRCAAGGFAGSARSAAFGKNIPIYLEELGFCRTLDELTVSVLGEFEQAYGKWFDEGFSWFRPEYDQYAALSGRFVSLLDRDGSVIAQGCVEGVDEAGRLLLRKPDGGLFAANSGEVHIA